MRVHYSFKYWQGSNRRTRNIYTLNSCFPCSSVKRLERDVERRQAGARLFSPWSFQRADVPISMIEDDRKRICFRGRTMAPNSMESSSGLVSDQVPWYPRGAPCHRFTTRISVACKLHFITCYPCAVFTKSLSAWSSPRKPYSSSCIFPPRSMRPLYTPCDSDQLSLYIGILVL